MTPRVVAVVVTWNRRDLLEESLEAVRGQTHRPAAIVVVDNASTDATEAFLAGQDDLDVVRLEQNTGGAGGFAVGIEKALTHEPDLLWLLDDDTVPGPEAAAALVQAWSTYDGTRRPSVLASKVVWTDGREHPMNTPRRKPGARRAEVRAAERVGAVPVRSASFVSIMCDATAVRERGLPVADYFLWNDDFEYSTRLIRDRVGLHVPASVVTHKTAKFGATDVDPGERFFFEVRNKVWLFSRSRSLSAGREGAVRRLHDPPLGTHRRPLRRPPHPAPGGSARPAGRAATRPARQRGGPRGGRLDRRRPHARPRTAVLAADEHVRRRPARVPAGGVRLHRRRADPAARRRSCSCRTARWARSSAPRSSGSRRRARWA